MRPEWRSTTVVALSDAIVAEKAYERLPIQADALEEAGCDDPGLLHALRGGDDALQGPWLARVLQGVVTFTQVREATGWLTRHAAVFGNDYDENGREPGPQMFAWLMGVCDHFVQTGEIECLGYLTPDEAGMEAATMWTHYEVLTGTPMPVWGNGPESYPVIPFRCAC